MKAESQEDRGITLPPEPRMPSHPLQLEINKRNMATTRVHSFSPTAAWKKDRLVTTLGLFQNQPENLS